MRSPPNLYNKESGGKIKNNYQIHGNVLDEDKDHHILQQYLKKSRLFILLQ